MPDLTPNQDAVSPEEMAAAYDPSVGHGTPETAPHLGTDEDGDVADAIVATTPREVIEVKTDGLSPKFKLAGLFGTLVAATCTALAVIFPGWLPEEAWVAISVWAAAVSAALGAFIGNPGHVVPEDNRLDGV